MSEREVRARHTRPMAAAWRTGDGYTVKTVSTIDCGQWFQVTHPGGVNIPLEPWDPQHSAPIRTVAQLAEVLAREGQHLDDLKEISR